MAKPWKIVEEKKVEPTITGLTWGKFAPFHVGHKWFLENALSKVDLLYVLVLDSMKLLIEEGMLEDVETRCFILDKTFEGEAMLTIPVYDCPTGPVLGVAAHIIEHMPVEPDIIFHNEHVGRVVQHLCGAELYTVDKHREQFHLNSSEIRTDPEGKDYLRIAV